MTPEKFIQDFWAGSASLMALVPTSRVITGEHDRMQSQALPCILIDLQTDVPDYHTSSKRRRKATVRVKAWGSLSQVIATKNALIDEQNGIHRAAWSGTGYVVSLANVPNQFHDQQEDGEWQGISEIELDYSLN